MKALHCVAFVLAMIGALNWGLVGIGGFTQQNWSVVNLLLGSWPAVEWTVYLLVGISGLVLIFTHKRDCRMCVAGGADGMSVGSRM